MPSPLLHNGLIYIAGRNRGQISCYETATGKTIYQNAQLTDGVPFWASPWASNDRIYCLDEKGTTHVIQPGPELKVLFVNSLDDKMWSSVAAGRDAYVFRGVSYLWCVKK